MSEQGTSRIADAKQRALDAKQKLGVAAAAAFVAIVGLAWVSHPGSSSASAVGSTSTDQSSVTADDSSSFEEDDDFGGFNSFGSIAPSGSATPQAQTHVS